MGSLPSKMDLRMRFEDDQMGAFCFEMFSAAKAPRPNYAKIFGTPGSMMPVQIEERASMPPFRASRLTRETTLRSTSASRMDAAMAMWHRFRECAKAMRDRGFRWM